MKIFREFRCLSLALAAWALGAVSARAQTEEEMRLLRLFYQDEQLVVSPTRYPIPIAKVAENISVITADEIERMNAHSLAEVLNRLAGVFVEFQGEDFGSSSFLEIQGSEDRHVLVLLDGMKWNFLSAGNAETVDIPVQIIERIEVIKGPASSSWGSALGGVINIITKPAGDSPRPGGTILASLGEKETTDDRAELYGLAGPMGYYLYAGHQASDGLGLYNSFEQSAFYGKLRVPLPGEMLLILTGGGARPDIRLDYEGSDLDERMWLPTWFGTINLDAAPAPGLLLNFNWRHLSSRWAYRDTVLTTGELGAAGDFFQEAHYHEATEAGGARAVWARPGFTAVAGLDYERGDVRYHVENGPYFISSGYPEVADLAADTENLALYANVTIEKGSWSFTPGVRWDHNDAWGDFTSPSLGATLRLPGETVLRAFVARGFSEPGPGETQMGGLFFDPNPGLKPETVNSIQLGLETKAPWGILLKADFFLHEVDDALETITNPDSPAGNMITVNDGKVERRGAEIEVRTAPWRGFTFRGGATWVLTDPDAPAEEREQYKIALTFAYDDGKAFSAQLFGRYVWWNESSDWGGEYDQFIWDFTAARRVWKGGWGTAEAVFSAHNLFNGSSYTLDVFGNPRRWIEGGLRLKF